MMRDEGEIERGSQTHENLFGTALRMPDKFVIRSMDTPTALSPVPRSTEPPSRAQRLFTLALELVFYGLLTYVLFYAADYLWDHQVERSFLAGSVYFILDTFLLYMHEGGHFLFSLFGSTLHLFGGSFWEVMLPFVVFVFALRDRSRIAPFPLYYSGLGLMRVSLYVRDAPYRRLPLLGGDKSRHDWWNLLNRWDMLSSAETIADILYGLATIMCVAALAAGFYLAWNAYWKPNIQTSRPVQSLLEQNISKGGPTAFHKE